MSSPTAAVAPAVQAAPPTFNFGFELESKQMRSFRVNDMFCVRKALNDCIYEYMTTEREAPACTRVDNLRLMLGLVSVVIGAWSHLDKTPFPQIVPFLIQCIVFYHILALLLFLTYRYLEGDAFLVTTPLKGKRAGALAGKSVQFSSAVEAFQPFYTLEVKLLGPAPQFVFQKRRVVNAVRTRISIGKFFDQGGYVFPPNIKAEVDKLLDKLAMGDSGASSVAKKKGGSK